MTLTKQSINKSWSMDTKVQQYQDDTISYINQKQKVIHNSEKSCFCGVQKVICWLNWNMHLVIKIWFEATLSWIQFGKERQIWHWPVILKYLQVYGSFLPYVFCQIACFLSFFSTLMNTIIIPWCIWSWKLCYVYVCTSIYGHDMQHSKYIWAYMLIYNRVSTNLREKKWSFPGKCKEFFKEYKFSSSCPWPLKEDHNI